MYVSQTLLGYLDRADVDFELVTHQHTSSSTATARAAQIEDSCLAKAVLMRSDDDYVLAVVPASRQVNPFAVRELCDDDFLSFAYEDEMPAIFRDCERGAVPIVGEAFGVRTAVDDDLLLGDDVYFEAGDHEHLVHIRHAEFARLMRNQLHGHISC